MMLNRSKIEACRFMAAAVATLLLAAPVAQAAPVIGLELLIDESGSISSNDFALQNNGYIAALNAVLPTDGSVAVGIKTFGGSVATLFNLQTITAITKASLIAALTTNTQARGGTPTGLAIQAGQAELLNFTGLTRRIIDVSTDGFGNATPITENAAATAAVNAGINQVNVLCIGPAANCTFNAGTGSFNLPATFNTFQATLTTKLQRELAVPEPASMALLGTGLLGLGMIRRRRA